MRLIGLILGTIAALAATAFVVERQSAIDRSVASLTWGGGSAPAIAAEMVPIAAGSYVVGDETRRAIEVGAYLIDRHEVTNLQFAEFVSATGYVTGAEREGSGWVYRGGERDWTYVRGASWRHPLGPGSSIDRAMNHPVVLVSWDDANAYARWAGKRLPTETEWEVAARGGAPAPASEISTDRDANFWQGEWPRRNVIADGFFYTAPAGSFPPNGLGLYDTIGNVWEWTSDLHSVSADGSTLRVAKGGSWFCSRNYCGAYRPGFRGKSPQTRAFNNVGFRCARDITPRSMKASPDS